MTHHYNTFRDQLAIAHPAFGYALWETDPGEQYPPVEVGDVGFIREGKFHRLFNALLPEDHQSHQLFGVPDGYEPLRLSTLNHVDHATLDPNNFCSHGVMFESGGSEFQAAAPPTSDSAEVAFLCRRKQGAVLSLPVVARREDTRSRAHFGTWMIRYIDSWFAFSQLHGLGIQMEDIILVTGSHRTRSRSNIVFYDSQVDSRVSLRVQTPGMGTTVRWQVLSQLQGAILSHGPSGENLPQNQCLFIRGFRVKRFLWILPRLKGAAEPKPDPRGNDPEPEMELVPIPSVIERRDPLHVLLDYIATRTPGCNMALVHDDDLVPMLGVSDETSLETLQPDVVMDYLQRSKFEIGVMSVSWTATNESPRTNTESMTVAMLSEQLHSFHHRDAAAGGTSDINLDPGNESRVVVTGVEPESIAPSDVPRHTFGLKQKSPTTWGVQGHSAAIGWSPSSGSGHAARPSKGGLTRPSAPPSSGRFTRDLFGRLLDMPLAPGGATTPVYVSYPGGLTPQGPPPFIPRNAEQAESYSWFVAIDQDNNGEISPQELQNALMDDGGLRFSKSTVMYLMSIFDLDNSKGIAFKEFESLWKYITQWRQMFESFDIDNNGTIDADEVGRALAHYDLRVGPPVLDLLVKKYATPPLQNRGPHYGPPPPPQIDLDHFVCACVVVRQMCQLYEQCSGYGAAQISRDDFIRAVISLP